MLLEFIVRQGRKEWGDCVVGQSENMFRKKGGEKALTLSLCPAGDEGN